MWHRSPCKRDIRVCMALELNRNLDNIIPTTPGVLCCIFKASQCFQTPFWAVYLSAAGPRASLYCVTGKVGNLKSNLNVIWPVIWGEHFGNLAKICFRSPASPHTKTDDLRSFRSNFFSEKFIYWDTGLHWKQSLFQIGHHFCRWLSRVPGMSWRRHGETKAQALKCARRGESTWNLWPATNYRHPLLPINIIQWCTWTIRWDINCSKRNGVWKHWETLKTQQNTPGKLFQTWL